MTVQSNLLMLRLAQARKSCPSYPAHWEQWTALTPPPSPLTCHHRSSALCQLGPFWSHLTRPGSPCPTQTLAPKILWGDPGLPHLRGSSSLSLLHFALRNLSFSPFLSCFLNPLRYGYTSWDHRWKAESFCLLSALSPLPSCWLSSSACLPQPLLLSQIPPSAATSSRSFLLLPMCSWLFCSPF